MVRPNIEDDGRERWIGDYRSIGRTPLDQELRQHLGELHRKSRRFVVIVYLLIPVAVIVTQPLTLPYKPWDMGTFILPWIVGLCALPVSMCIANRANIRRKWARRNLRVGRIERFEPSPQAIAHTQALRAIGRIPKTDLGPAFLDVYCADETLARVGDKILYEPASAGIAVTAASLRNAASLVHSTRRLSETELEELRAGAKKVRYAAPMWAFALLVGGFILILYLVGVNQMVYPVVAVISLAMFARLWGVRRRARSIKLQMISAVEIGVVELLERDEAVARLRAAGQATTFDDLGVFERAEVLSGTLIPWTVDGEPAPWRRFHAS